MFPACRCAFPRENVEQLLPSLTRYIVKLPLSLSPLNTLCCLCLAAVAAKVAEWKERMAKIASGEISKDEDLPEENLYPAEEVGMCCLSVCLSVCLLTPFTLLKRLASSVCPFVCLAACSLYSVEEVHIFCLSVCLLATFTLLKRLASSVCPFVCLAACSLYSVEEVHIFCLSVCFLPLLC